MLNKRMPVCAIYIYIFFRCICNTDIFVTYVPAYVIFGYFYFVLHSFCVVVVGGTAACDPAHRPVPATNGLLPPADR